ncbi:MAG: hypothetical protein P1U56_07185 [Saprospiraceae bacterium]|nr:hypothetical protein [Saprospiraceae bacterium]
MRISVSILFLIINLQIAISQEQILFDLDSYRRVDFQFRSTYVSPDIKIDFDNVLNSPATTKEYSIFSNGVINDNKIVNNQERQKSWNHRFAFELGSGTTKMAGLDYTLDYENRLYSKINSEYFLQGVRINVDIDYSVRPSNDQRYNAGQLVHYDIGFGFGRLEVVDQAWLGARILEELHSKELLQEIPDENEMRLFFDLLGDLEFERVFDSRLRSIYRMEKIIQYIQDKGWIEKGSIPAFVTINDTYRFERFFNRWTGERLEFILTPYIRNLSSWRRFSQYYNSNLKEPGFEGRIEYEIHSNGDLEYYTKKCVGGSIKYSETFVEQGDIESSHDQIQGLMYFQYQYRYIPSLRTNLELNVGTSGGFIYDDGFTARINLGSSLTYNYYISPATQLVLTGYVNYHDSEFQVGDYQPRITSQFSFDIRHLIR